MPKAFIDALVFREGYVLIDFPRMGQPVKTLAEEDAAGKSRAYLVRYSPQQLINWRLDSHGDFEWVVLKTQSTYQEKLEDSETITEQRWLYFDRENFKTYSRKKRESGPGTENPGATAGDGVALVAEGRHGLANLRRVPLVKMTVTDGLWLANKTALLQQEHFNKSNALSWALHMGLFAMPVIYSDREWQQIVGEAYYIQLGPNDRFGWTEPEGHVFQIAADNLDRLKNEIYRVCYMMNQAGGRESRNLGQSGVSKQRDFAVTHEVLRSYGNTVKDFLRQVLDLIRLARRDEVEIEVAGMDKFDIPDDGYPVDSGSPNILWFGDFLGFCNRVNNHLVSRRIHGYRLLDEPIEEFAAAFGFAAVETEGELVQVVVQMFVAHGALMGAQQPALEQ